MIWLNIFLLALLGGMSIVLASVEGAFYLVKRRRLGHVSSQNPRAELVNLYLEDPPSLLMPIHMGTYSAHVGMTVVITSMFLDHLAHWAMLVAFAVMVAYLVLFRLTLPYALVRRNPERSLLLLLPMVDGYVRALSPLVRWLRRRAAGDLPSEITEVPGNGKAAPEVPPAPVHDPDEVRLVEAMGRFADTQVREIMTPRPDIVSVAASDTIAELRKVFRDSKYSRVLVRGENLDDVVGVITVRDLVEYDDDDGAPLRPLARPPFLVPETKKIAELLKEMQAQRYTIAVVIDEYGGTAGLVSIEDIVEELVGEIKDEYDVEAEPITAEADGSLLVSGRVSLERLELALETPLAEGEGDVGTVGGLVSAIFGRVPRPGERTEYRGFTVEVTDAERRRVNRVRFRRVPVREVARA